MNHTRMQLELLERLGHSDGKIRIVMNRTERKATVSATDGSWSFDLGSQVTWEPGDHVFTISLHDDPATTASYTFDVDLFAEQASAEQIKMIELKISQGAKPGHGGILPAAKVTPEIAEARKVPLGVACFSLSRYWAS